MMHWLWMAFCFFVGVGCGWWACSGVVLAKIADMRAEIQRLVEECEHWARERERWAVRP